MGGAGGAFEGFTCSLKNLVRSSLDSLSMLLFITDYFQLLFVLRFYVAGKQCGIYQNHILFKTTLF